MNINKNIELYNIIVKFNINIELLNVIIEYEY